MINKFVNFIKRDYNSVESVAKWLSNGKIPTLVIIIWYIFMLPIGLLLYFPLKMMHNYYLKKLHEYEYKDET